ncbi:IS200/IS605 family transposase [Algoriphagus chordae]|uniref:REP element-mobilizing transposase RayT n=1 Tax=Algoriphagus chordae TaxID=237019 RepID=A0A2W7R488_9BACT|nr:IS200/IS605 family transposase [Algoriphagus chordae]PZX54026.1 REP element-mobilizing transposase RayT [Algoriphagus chordae]
MSFVKVYIHLVWSTKNRYPYLNSKELRLKIWNHIRENGHSKGIFVDFINGYSDHCHCLISLGVNQTIEKTLQLLKGESSFWINKNKLTQKKFEWQDEYYAVSVSESQLDKVRDYIKKQEDHHQSKTFSDEYEEFLVKFGFQKLKDELG